MGKHTIVSIFSGGGLLDLGFMAEGNFKVVWACDNDLQAVKAYKHNLGDHIRHADITKVNFSSLRGKVDGLLGGPPCQDFSVAGSGAGIKGDNGRLVIDYIKKLNELKPKWFLFENVPGLVTKKHLPAFELLLKYFSKVGYKVDWRVLNAWEYGVAQNRKRVFIVGIRKDLPVEYEWPKPWPEKKRKVLRDVIGDLPEPQYQVNGKHLSNNFNSEYESLHRNTEWGEPSPTVTAHHRCAYIHPNHGYKRLTHSVYNHSKRLGIGFHALDKPAKVVRTNGEEVLSDIPRRFTVRECLRVQSVPDWYKFPDETIGVTDRKEKISLSAQYRIVGNGVPSLLALQLARQLAKAFGLREA